MGAEGYYHESLSSLLACGDFCSLLMTIAISLDPDKDRQNVGPYLDPSRLPF